MTRQEAIEAAMLRLFGEYLPQHKEAMVALHEQGRIAGLREAARLVASGNAPCSVNMRPDTYAWKKSQDVRKRARELAKKARGK